MFCCIACKWCPTLFVFFCFLQLWSYNYSCLLIPFTIQIHAALHCVDWSSVSCYNMYLIQINLLTILFTQLGDNTTFQRSASLCIGMHALCFLLHLMTFYLTKHSHSHHCRAFLCSLEKSNFHIPWTPQKIFSHIPVICCLQKHSECHQGAAWRTYRCSSCYCENCFR